MQVPSSALANYADALNGISEQGQAEARRLLSRIDYSDLTRAANQAVEVMETVCGASSTTSARLAAIFYDELRRQALGEAMGAYTESGRAPVATEKAVRAFIQKLVEGGEPDEFIELCQERVGYEVKRAAGRCTQYNVGHDPSGETRYARVPTGAETCEFCIMLASRGPVYHTEETAGAYDHYHAHCDCMVVPFFNTFELGPSRRGSAMSVEGYDPDEYYEQYLGGKFAHGGQRSGGSTSHPMSWARAADNGEVTFTSVGEIKTYFRESTSYEDLMERIDRVSAEWERYGLSETYRKDILTTLRNIRRRYVE